MSRLLFIEDNLPSSLSESTIITLAATKNTLKCRLWKIYSLNRRDLNSQKEAVFTSQNLFSGSYYNCNCVSFQKVSLKRHYEPFIIFAVNFLHCGPTLDTVSMVVSILLSNISRFFSLWQGATCQTCNWLDHQFKAHPLKWVRFNLIMTDLKLKLTECQHVANFIWIRLHWLERHFHCR